ncbi:hypothetical protein CGCSCA2_v006020 [Colletotrichum siamense]|uniref:Uncharacterized protein n=1 Tax=Colletotrichum siamense TaxID=690259 RepID=A0A9P5ETQ2_COLSI|nr:hypothetical protein CGCSCA2_v006020 [Colletotrichum siamense]
MKETWDKKLRPLNSVPDAIIPGHAWCMEPSVQMPPREEKAGITVFFPYLNWETFGKMKKQREEFVARRTDQQRRTLDEFYYSGLRNTASRNAGQTVSKWTGKDVRENGRDQAVEDSHVILVDQLWIWILDDFTVLSCFPMDLGQEPGDSTDIMASVKAEINNCEDTLDVLALLVSHSVIQVLEGSSQKQADMLAIYRWAAANKAARHSELLEKFWKRQSAHSIEAQETEGSEELNLTLEVVDLLDELNILMLVFEKQDNVVSELLTNLSLIKPKEDGKRGGPEQRIVFEGCSLGDVRLNTSGDSTAEMLFRGSSIGDLETFANVLSNSLGG